MEFDTVTIPDTNAEKPYHVKDGEWVTIMRDGKKPGLWGCCDCGLMHRVEFKVDVDSGNVYFKVYRDEEATRIRREVLHQERQES